MNRLLSIFDFYGDSLMEANQGLCITSQYVVYTRIIC